MRLRGLLVFVILSVSVRSIAQNRPEKDYPILFRTVQMGRIFNDSKTFSDAIPLINPKIIDSCFMAEIEVNGYSLTDFLETYFLFDRRAQINRFNDSGNAISIHINSLWPYLMRYNPESTGTLIGLPHPYIVPGGRFTEMYYWDSYFTMLGLKEYGDTSLIENMINNFACLIDSFGFIPNGNRTYYLSRSQPPFFSLMVSMLSELMGKETLVKYLPELEKEYQFWMSGKKQLSKKNNAVKRVVRIHGIVLNRHWDDYYEPRAEAYFEDVKVARQSRLPDSIDFRNIRAACESGWDFSSRWLSDKQSLYTIETTNILPVDLNCLMYNLELTLSEAYKLNHQGTLHKKYSRLAKKRAKAIEHIFWDKKEGFYADYNFIDDKLNDPFYISGIYPLFFQITSKKRATAAANYLESNFLCTGGLITSLVTTDQQWDSPFGWAPLQFMAVRGLRNYKEDALANEITTRWIRLNNNTYAKTGKLLEKYNVVDPSSKKRSGEYPNQDGFGWTNGVLLYLLKENSGSVHIK